MGSAPVCSTRELARHEIEHTMTDSEEKGAQPQAPDDAPHEDQADGDEGAVGADAVDGSAAAAFDGEAPASDVERHLAIQQDRYLRLAAEYDNYRKRTAKERLEAHSRAQGELVKEMLDALDDLARFAHVDPTVTEAATIVQGVELVERKLIKALSAAGLEPMNPVDQAFDPTLHEAIATEPALSPEDDQIVSQVYQQGYLFNGQLLRPARVVVKQWNG